MKPILIEAGLVDFDSAVALSSHVIAATRLHVRVIYADHARDLEYATHEAGMSDALRLLQSGEVATIAASTSAGEVAASLTRPRAFEGSPSLWYVTFDRSPDDWQDTFLFALTIHHLRWIAAVELEALDVGDGELSVDTFPWTRPGLILGAVRVGDLEANAFAIRRGPAFGVARTWRRK